MFLPMFNPFGVPQFPNNRLQAHLLSKNVIVILYHYCPVKSFFDICNG